MSIVATHPNPYADTYRTAGHWPQQSLGTLFHQTAQRHAERVALIDADRRFTFHDLEQLVDSTVRGFQALGLGCGDVIAYQLPNWWEAVVVFLSAARMGATVNPLLPIFRASELRFTLRQSGAQALVIPGMFRGCDHRELLHTVQHDLPALRTVFVVRDDAPTGMHRFNELLEPPHAVQTGIPPIVDPNSIALLMYTSGTTAEPKGVLHTHNTLAAEVLSLERVHRLTPQDRTLMPSPLTHISGVIHAILAPALLGTSAVLMERWDAASARALIDSEQVTYMVGAPTFLQDLIAAAEAEKAIGAGGSLRLFSCGGAAVSPALMQQARQTFPNCVAKRVYGSTEFPTMTTTEAADALSHGIETEGRPIEPAEVRIADDHGISQPSGTEGEVQGRGPECFVGYRDAVLNTDSFTADGWFRTGDLGVLDTDGYLRITGRLKDIIIRKGEKISVKEVEDVIAAHPSVAEVVVIPRHDPATGERACALVRLRPDARLDLAQLRAFLATQGLAKQKWPEQLDIVDDFPRTESGKILRTRLRGA